MNTLKRILLLVALMTAPVGTQTLLAEEAAGGGTTTVSSSDQRIIASIPRWSKGNPYAEKAYAAQKVRDAKLADLQKLLVNDPYNFDAQIEAYYAYTRAEAEFRALAQKADAWEKNDKADFSGHVYAAPNFPLLKSDKPQPAVAEDGVRHMPIKQEPIAGAIVVLRANMAVIMKDGPQPLKPAKDEARPAIYPMPPIPVKEYKATTGEKGDFRFANVPAGSYSMTVTKEKYSPWRGSVVVPKHGKVDRTVYLSKIRTFSGVVRTIPLKDLELLRSVQARSGTTGSLRAGHVQQLPKHRLLPVADAAVYLSGMPIIYARGQNPPTTAPGVAAPDAQRMTRPMPWQSYKTKTLKDGSFRIENVQPGRYQMRVYKDGLNPFEGAVTIDETTEKQDIVLLPKLPIPVPMPKPLPVPMDRKPMDAPVGGTLDRPFDQ